jgi:hypothetical protein
MAVTSSEKQHAINYSGLPHFLNNGWQDETKTFAKIIPSTT